MRLAGVRGLAMLASNVPAFQASIPFVVFDHALTRVATSFRRFAPGLLPSRSKHKIGSDFHTSLEEAAMSRPGREAGNRPNQTRRAPKVRHRNRADRDFFTALETRGT